ncbi:MAG: META and DUF4377 domain-containing protein [Deltaproteobacteria bacterium]|nr:META and DUF4377 domain-containing protein [Deltaproteobacteria bacterium]
MTRHILLSALILSLLGVSVGACAGASTPTSSTAPSATAEPDALTTHHWQLVEATTADGARITDLFPDPDRAIQIDFAEGRVSVSNACNRMSGTYTLADDRLTVGDVMQTEMACDDARMRAESAIGRVVRAGGTLRIEANEGDRVLVWTTPGSDTLRFRGEPTADARYGGPGERVFFEIAPARVSCGQGDGCLSVREVRYDESGIVVDRGGWEILTQPIEGYTHEAGVRNVLRLTRYTIASPSADGPSIAYVLDMVVESEIVAP